MGHLLGRNSKEMCRRQVIVEDDQHGWPHAVVVYGPVRGVVAQVWSEPRPHGDGTHGAPLPLQEEGPYILAAPQHAKRVGVHRATGPEVPEVTRGPDGRIELRDLPPKFPGLPRQRRDEAVDGCGVLQVPQQLAAAPAGDVAPGIRIRRGGGGTLVPNGTGTACTTTFTAPSAGSGIIVVSATQGSIAAAGLAVYEVAETETTSAGQEREASPTIEFPADVTGSVVWRGESAFVTSPNGLTMAVPAGAIGSDFLGVIVREMSAADVVLPENPGFAVGSYAGDILFTDDAGHPMPGFRTGTPVRICLPFTQADLDRAVGGVDGVHVVHVTPGGDLFHHPPDSDVVSMITCADVDQFSVYFVGLAVEAPTPTVAPTPTASPALSPTATPFPTPVPTPTPVPERPPMAGPTPGATPILPVAGGARPGAGALTLVTLSAVAAIATGVVLLGRIRPVRPSR